MAETVREMTDRLKLTVDEIRREMGKTPTGYALTNEGATLAIGFSGTYRLMGLLSPELVVEQNFEHAEALKRRWNSLLSVKQLEAGCQVQVEPIMDALRRYLNNLENLLEMLRTHQ